MKNNKTTYRQNLPIQVQLINERNKYLQALLPVLEIKLNALIGKKIRTAADQFSKQWNIEAPELVNVTGTDENGEKFNLSIQSWFTVSYNWLNITVKLCVNGGEYPDHGKEVKYKAYTVYLNDRFCIGYLDNETKQFLASVTPAKTILTDWELYKVETVERLKSLIDQYKEFNNKATEILRLIPEQVRASEYVTRG
jgi:hypothetical protein